MRLRFDWPYSRRNRAGEPDNEPFDTDPPGVPLSHHGYGFHPTWKKTEMPSPGAEAYAFTSISLPPFSFVGTGHEPGFMFETTRAGLMQRQQARKDGIPTQSGGIVGQPLYDARAGGSTSAITSGLVNNRPFRRHSFEGGNLSVELY